MIKKPKKIAIIGKAIGLMSSIKLTALLKKSLVLVAVKLIMLVAILSPVGRGKAGSFMRRLAIPDFVLTKN